MLVATRSQGPGPTEQGQGHAEGDTSMVTEVTATPLTAHYPPPESLKPFLACGSRACSNLDGVLALPDPRCRS